jgi:hypothetical protein
MSNKLNRGESTELAKLEKELETSRNVNLKHEQTIFVSPLYKLTFHRN